MQERGSCLAGKILKLTFAVKASCLAKERCIPEIDNSEKIYLFGEKFLKLNKGVA
jgi:hypothetical protein